MKSTEMPPSATRTGHVKNGVVVLDAQIDLAEGQAVRVEPLSPSDIATDRDNRVRQLRQLFDQWTDEDSRLSDNDADCLRSALKEHDRVSFRTANV